MDTTIQGYMLTRFDKLQDMLIEHRAILTDLRTGQAALLVAAEQRRDSALEKLLRSWPLIVTAAVKHIITVGTIFFMVKQGADATSILDFLSKQF